MLSGIHVGISSVGVSIADLLARDGTDPLPHALRAWAAARQLDVLVLMTGHNTGPQGYTRELGVWAATHVAEDMLPALVRDALRSGALHVRASDRHGVSSTQTGELQSTDLQLKPLGSPAWPHPGVAWVQGNLKASRKAVQPALAAALERLRAK